MNKILLQFTSQIFLKTSPNQEQPVSREGSIQNEEEENEEAEFNNNNEENEEEEEINAFDDLIDKIFFSKSQNSLDVLCNVQWEAEFFKKRSLELKSLT